MIASSGGIDPTSSTIQSLHQPSPRTGAAAAPVSLPGRSIVLSPGSSRVPLIDAHLSSSSMGYSIRSDLARPKSFLSTETSRRHSDAGDHGRQSPGTVCRSNKTISDPSEALAKAQSRTARKINDSMVYLDGPQVYACAQCRTHLTSHDEIISKSFHGRHGRAYLFDNCVNVSLGPAEDRRLITGLHSVCDIFCKRCKTMVGWTYARAYEHSQKYKEGKFIVEKINLHLEESDYYDVAPPAGERTDRFRARSISWGNESCGSQRHETIFEYHPTAFSSGAPSDRRKRQGSTENSVLAEPHV